MLCAPQAAPRFVAAPAPRSSARLPCRPRAARSGAAGRGAGMRSAASAAGADSSTSEGPSKGVARLLALGASAAEAAAIAPFMASLEAAGSYYDTVAARVLRFCRVLGVSAPNASRIAATQPALCALDEAALRSRLAALRAALPAGTDAGEVLGKAPTLLLATAEDLAAARAELAFLPAEAVLAPLLEAEPTLMQAVHRGPRLPEVRAAWQAGPHAALPAGHAPADDAERDRLRRYAQKVLSSPYV